MVVAMGTVIQVVVVVVDPVAQVALELTVTLVEPRVLEVVDHHVHRLVEITDVLAVVDHRAHHLVELNVLQLVVQHVLAVVPPLVADLVDLIVLVHVKLPVKIIVLMDVQERANQHVRIVLLLEKKLAVLTTPVEVVVLLSVRHLVLAYVLLVVTLVVRPLVVIYVARLTHVRMAVKVHVPTVVIRLVLQEIVLVRVTMRALLRVKILVKLIVQVYVLMCAHLLVVYLVARIVAHRVLKHVMTLAEDLVLRHV